MQESSFKRSSDGSSEDGVVPKETMTSGSLRSLRCPMVLKGICWTSNFPFPPVHWSQPSTPILVRSNPLEEGQTHPEKP